MTCELPGMFYVSAMMLLFASATASLEIPSFRILAPKFICGNAANTNDTQTMLSDGIPQQIGISFQTKGGQKLRYRVAVLFTLLDGFISQRHTLQLWRSARQLEQRIDKDHEAVSASNQITIFNEELVSGVIYTFNIVGVDDNGVLSQDQNFTITYKGRNTRTLVDQDGSSSRDDVSLLLLCSEVCYSDLPYLVTAKVIFCKPRNDYKIIWTISDDRIGSIDTNSDLLTLPAGVLQPGESYEIAATVVDANSRNQIVKATVKVNVLKRALKGSIFPVEATTGFAQQTNIRAVFNNQPLSDISWSCEDSSGDKSCSADLISSPHAASISFMKDSRFKVTVSKENLSMSSDIKVNAKSTVSVSLGKMPAPYIIPGQQYEFLADVKGLVPKCVCNWTVVKEEGFAYFDPTSVGDLGSLVINDIEENFLSELVDYGNDTIERVIKLTIPASTNTSQWKGLERNVMYKFKLAIECPEPIDDSFNSNGNRGIVSSYWAIVLETNAPPEGIPLNIAPNSNGTALSTIYKLTTGIAKDTETDFPLKYSFWYIVEGHSINIANHYEVMSAETQLPYSKEGISIYYLVCDSREACSRVDGQSVLVQPNSHFGITERNFKLDSIQNHFRRGNSLEALKIAFELLLTFKNQNSSLFDDTYSKIMISLGMQIATIQESVDDRSLTTNSVLQFVQQARILIDFQLGANDPLLDQLLELIDSVDRISTRVPRSATRKPVPNIVDMDSTKIGIYKSLIVSPNGTTESKHKARHQLLNYIPEIAQRSCTNHQTGYSDDWFTLEVVRMKPVVKNPLRKPIRIPADTTVSQLATVVGVGGPDDGQLLEAASYLCLGSLVFHKDFLEGHVSERQIYTVFLSVFGRDDTEVMAEWTTGTYSWNVTGKSDSNSSEYQCQLWTEKLTNWSSDLCNTVTGASFVICNCTQMGYLRVIPFIRSEFSEKTTNSIITHSTSTTILKDEMENSTLTDYWSTTTESEDITLPEIFTLHSTRDNLENAVTTINAMYSSSNESSADLVTIQSISYNSTTVPIDDLTTENSTHSHLMAAAGPLGYSIIAALILCVILTAIALVLYKRRRHTTSLAEELQVVAGRVRSPALPVRYARFQDEHNMNGDNVSTISDAVTV